MVNKEVMRFKTFDMDLVNTDNWLADFKITSGNEAGYFKIITDQKTNEGVLIVQKVKESHGWTEYVKVGNTLSLTRAMSAPSICRRWTMRN